MLVNGSKYCVVCGGPGGREYAWAARELELKENGSERNMNGDPIYLIRCDGLPLGSGDVKPVNSEDGQPIRLNMPDGEQYFLVRRDGITKLMDYEKE